MPVGKEIKRLRISANLSALEFAKLAGVDVERLRKWEQRDAPPKDSADIQRIEKFFGTTLDKLNQLSSFAVDNLDISAKDSAKPQSATEEHGNYITMRRLQKNQKEQFYAPFLPIKARAGYTTTYDQITFLEKLEQHAIPPGINPAGAKWMYFEVEGDSMLPGLEDRDVILASMVPAEDWQDLRNFYIYVIVTESQLMVKRVFRKSTEEWVLISDNQDVYDQILQKVEEVKELWVLRRVIKAKVPPPIQFDIKL